MRGIKGAELGPQELHHHYNDTAGLLLTVPFLSWRTLVSRRSL